MLVVMGRYWLHTVHSPRYNGQCTIQLHYCEQEKCGMLTMRAILACGRMLNVLR